MMSIYQPAKQQEDGATKENWLNKFEPAEYHDRLYNDSTAVKGKSHISAVLATLH